MATIGKTRRRRTAARKTGQAADGRRERWAAHEERLRQRSAALRTEISGALAKYRAERDGLVADNVPDRAEQSTADLVADIYLSEVDRDVVELLAVEAALGRLATGVYGYCVDCERAIPARRLHETPHAQRCVRCQERSERGSRRPASL